MSRTISIVGGGRVGRTIGKCLHKLGWGIGAVVTQSTVTARAAVRAIGGGSAQTALTPELFAADVILLTTPDDSLPEVARALAHAGGNSCRGKIFLHTSGALDRRVLAPLDRRGAATGSVHPMQTFSGRGVPRLAGVTFAIEGAPRACRIARDVARSLGGVPVTIVGRDKLAYHSAAVLAAGSGFPLIEAGMQILQRIGFTRRQALQTLLPLTRQMLDNVERLGPRGAWTGPLSRRDYAVVGKQMQALSRFPGEFQQSYAVLALLAGRVLERKPATALRQIRRALKNYTGGTG